MTEFKREFFKHDPVLSKLFHIVKRKHVVPQYTQDTLFKNRQIKDFCEQSRHFAILPAEGRPNLYIHYDVASWFHMMGVVCKIEAITVYDDFMEYEKSRMTQLHSAKKSDIPNIN